MEVAIETEVMASRALDMDFDGQWEPVEVHEQESGMIRGVLRMLHKHHVRLRFANSNA